MANASSVKEKSSLLAQNPGSDVRASADSGESTHGKLFRNAWLQHLRPMCTWKELKRQPKLQSPPTLGGMVSWCTWETEENGGGNPLQG